ncbi:MAG: ECF transporter S component [Clostridia bacterium]|jgi:thiamine transporter ThiT|nr:ECF transporter S component [Clostridia bacterium]MBQ6093409.1 ECF transporter S component [Clostridia bacterium]
MQSKQDNRLLRLTVAALMLAFCMVLPFLTGQVQQIANKVSLMHLPVLLCGYFCGPWYGLAVGIVAPLMRSFLFHMPAMFPNAIGMAFELGTYGLVTGLLYRLLPKRPGWIYVSLLAAMLLGRLVWGLSRTALAGLGGDPFTLKLFLTNGFINAVPAVALQLLAVPVLVMAVYRAFPRLRPAEKPKETANSSEAPAAE